jgi:hypothetical protein
MTRLFFATDTHGSEVCWRKTVNAGKFYEAQVLILGGDMTGKALIPIVERDGVHRASFLGQEVTAHGEEEVRAIERSIADRGYYTRRMTAAECEELTADPAKVEKLFLDEALATMRRWLAFADERLGAWGIKLYVCPGNDDTFEIDAVIEEEGKHVVNAEGKVIPIDSDFTMLSTGWCNPTPWNTHRECDEEGLAQRIRALVVDVPDLSRCVFNLHAPPYGSGLDEAPELDANLRPKYAGKSLVPVGSTAVTEILDECRPPLCLVGHIHEGKGVKRVGKTLIINPGSSYEQGTLLGAIVDLDPRKGVSRYMLVSG